MNLDDFRCIRQGQVLSLPSEEEVKFLQSYEKIGIAREKALLMLHGYSSSPAVFRTFYPHLNEYDTIIAPALPGHGQSIKDFASARAQDWLAFAEQQCQALVSEYKQVDVLGLSLGGLIACHLSQRFNLHHLYLLAPALDLQLPISSTLLLAQSLNTLGFRAIRNLAGNIHIPNHCEITYRQLPICSIIEILKLIQTFDWQQPQCPTDVFLGYYDEVVASRRVAKRFNGIANIHWLKRSAHILPLDGDSEQIIAHINNS